MEGSQSRKRTRDQTETDDVKEFSKGKKPEFSFSDDMFGNEKADEFGDCIGVFEFPWLKDGVVYKGNEYFQPEDCFSACTYDLDQDWSSFSSNLGQYSYAHDYVLPPAAVLDQNLHEKNKFEDDSFWPSFQVDDFEPVELICRSVMDQPLDRVGLNKA